jgi:hypothetical protein
MVHRNNSGSHSLNSHNMANNRATVNRKAVTHHHHSRRIATALRPSNPHTLRTVHNSNLEGRNKDTPDNSNINRSRNTARAMFVLRYDCVYLWQCLLIFSSSRALPKVSNLPTQAVLAVPKVSKAAMVVLRVRLRVVRKVVLRADMVVRKAALKQAATQVLTSNCSTAVSEKRDSKPSTHLAALP